MLFKLVVDQFEKVISATALEKRSVLLGRMFMENDFVMLTCRNFWHVIMFMYQLFSSFIQDFIFISFGGNNYFCHVSEDNSKEHNEQIHLKSTWSMSTKNN